MSKKDKKLVYIYLGLAVLVLLVVGIFRNSIFGLGETGEISLLNIEANTLIYLDSIEKKRVSEARPEVVLKRVSPGVHSVLVSRDGFWPWLKEVEVKTREAMVLSPFFVYSNTNGLLIDKSDPEYRDIISNIESIEVASFENKKVSTDRKALIWVDKGTLFTEWLGDEDDRPEYFCNEFGCHNVLVVLGVGGDIRNVEFYKNRNDVFIVAFGTGIFALEADVVNNQNFQPIFEGGSPQFILNDGLSVYVRNNEALFQVAI